MENHGCLRQLLSIVVWGSFFTMLLYCCIVGIQSCSDGMGSYNNKKIDWKVTRETQQINEYENYIDDNHNSQVDYSDYKIENPDTKIQALDSIVGR